LPDDAQPVGEDVVLDDLAVTEGDPADAPAGEPAAGRRHAEQRAALNALHVPEDNDPVSLGDQVGHRGPDVADGLVDPPQVLVERIPAGRRAGFVDRVGRDDLLKDLRALSGDRLFVQAARGGLVRLGTHSLA
jgi:hypothetical protein